jgi:hypothetical protein
VKSPRALLPTEGVDAARSRGDRFDSFVLQSGGFFFGVRWVSTALNSDDDGICPLLRFDRQRRKKIKDHEPRVTRECGTLVAEPASKIMASILLN